jgi:hypothetical protein
LPVFDPKLIEDQKMSPQNPSEEQKPTEKLGCAAINMESSRKSSLQEEIGHVAIAEVPSKGLERRKSSIHDVNSQYGPMKLPCIPQIEPTTIFEAERKSERMGSRLSIQAQHKNSLVCLNEDDQKVNDSLNEDTEEESVQSVHQESKRRISTEIDGADELLQWKTHQTTLATSKLIPTKNHSQLESERQARVMRLIESQKLPPIGSNPIHRQSILSSNIRSGKQYSIHYNSALAQKYGTFLSTNYSGPNR